jgi:hypothetical protein
MFLAGMLRCKFLILRGLDLLEWGLKKLLKILKKSLDFIRGIFTLIHLPVENVSKMFSRGFSKPTLSRSGSSLKNCQVRLRATGQNI